jgi:hypothetical protein
VHFTGGWILRAEGIDALAPYTQPTLTALEAARYARSFGGLDAACTLALARDPLPPLAACIGDVVFFEGTGAAGTLGICNGFSAIVLAPTEGFSSTPMSKAKFVWKIRHASE